MDDRSQLVDEGGHNGARRASGTTARTERKHTCSETPRNEELKNMCVGVEQNSSVTHGNNGGGQACLDRT